jgi:ADP-ribose pyrophosphatase YjhB (NUDIX family)
MPASEYVRSLRAKLGHDLLQVPAVGVVTLDASRRVLLVRAKEDNKWTIPGGMIEPGESPSDAAVREMKEETGLDVELIRILGVFGGPLWRVVYSNGDAISLVSTTFEARVIGGTMKPDLIEVLEARYFSEEETFSIELKPTLQETLRVVFGQGDSPYFLPPSANL